MLVNALGVWDRKFLVSLSYLHLQCDRVQEFCLSNRELPECVYGKNRHESQRVCA